MSDEKYRKLNMPAGIRRKYERYLLEEERKITEELEAFYKKYGKEYVITYLELIKKAHGNLYMVDVVTQKVKMPPVIQAIHKKMHYITRLDYLLMDIQKIKDAYSKKLNALVNHTFNFHYMPKNVQKDILKDTQFFFKHRGRREVNQIAKYIIEASNRGQSYKTVSSQLHKQYNINRKKAQILYRTENSKINTYIHIKTLKEEGHKAYKFEAHPGCCPYCAALNNKIILMKDIEKSNLQAKKTADMCGNIPPLHPGCRCTIVAPIR